MNRKQLYNLIIITILILSSFPMFIIQHEPVQALGNSYYVAKTGNDGNVGSFASPWLTIQYGINHMGAGDTLYVENGDYNENISIFANRSGTSSQWTTITSYTHWGATINGNGKAIEGWPGSEGLVFIRNVSYLRFTGFQIKNSTYKGIDIYGWLTNHIRVDNNSFYNISDGACNVRRNTAPAIPSDPTVMCQNVTIENNTAIHICTDYRNGYVGPASGEGLALGDCKNSVIRFNIVKKCSKECINVIDCRNCAIRNNVINNTHEYYLGTCEVGILCGGWNTYNDHIQIYNNRIWGNETGIFIEVENTATITSNISVYNNIIDLNRTGPNQIGIAFGNEVYRDIIISSNTIYETGIHPASVSKTITCDRNKNQLKRVNITNNILYNPNGFYCINFGGINRTDKCVTFSNNLYHNIGWESKTLNNWLGSDSEDLTFDAHYVDAVPLLRNQKAGDFHLNITSPCINKGTSTFAPVSDFEGNARPQGAGYDLGAYELSLIKKIFFNDSFRNGPLSNHKVPWFNTSFKSKLSSHFTTWFNTSFKSKLSSHFTTWFNTSFRNRLSNHFTTFFNTSFKNTKLSSHFTTWFNTSFKNNQLSSHFTIWFNCSFRNKNGTLLTVTTNASTNIGETTTTLNGYLFNSSDNTYNIGFNYGISTSYGNTYNVTNAIYGFGQYVYVGGSVTQKIYQYWKSNMTKRAESADYGGIIYAIVADNQYVYAAGDTTQKIYQYWASNLTKKSESSDYGGTLRALSIDDTYIYAGGEITLRVYQYWKSNLTFKAQSSNPHQVTIVAIDSDNTYVYADYEGIVRLVYQYWRSNMTFRMATTVSYINYIMDISHDDTYIYYGGQDTHSVWKARKSDMVIETQSPAVYGNIYHVVVDGNYVYVTSLLSNLIYKLWKSNLTISVTSADTGSSASPLGFDSNFLYVGKSDGRFNKFFKFNLINKTTSPTNYGGGIASVYGLNYSTPPFSFSSYISSLIPGQKYHFRALASNLNGTVYGSDLTFLTRPSKPTGPVISTIDSTKIFLAWTSGAGANTTKIQSSTTEYPATNTSGTTVFNKTSSINFFTNTNVTSGSIYYYRAWSYTYWNSLHQWSSTYTDLSILTKPSQPTIPRFISYKTSVNVTWTGGTGSNRTISVSKTTGFPTSRTDGSILSNTTTAHNFVNYSMTSGQNFNLINIFSYKNKTGAYNENLSTTSMNDTSVLRGRGWIIKDSGIQVGNTLFNVSKNMYFSNIVIPTSSSAPIKLNETYIQVTSANPLTFQLDYLRNKTVYPSANKFISFNATTTSPSVQFQLNKVTPSTKYYLYVDGNYANVFTSTASGWLTFTWSSWTSHHFTLFTSLLNFTIIVKYENYTYKQVNLSRYGPHQLIVQYFDHREVNWIYNGSFYYNESKITGTPNFKKGLFNISITSNPLWLEFHWNDTNTSMGSTKTIEKFTGYSRSQNRTITYVELTRIPISRSYINVTCVNMSATTTTNKLSYPSFIWDGNLLVTIYPNTAKEFSQINITYSYSKSFGRPRCNRILIPTASSYNLTFYILTDKLVYQESTNNMNDSIVKYAFTFDDRSGFFFNRPSLDVYAYVYTYDNKSNKMIIDKEYWDSSQRVYPGLLFGKRYFIGVGSSTTIIDDVGISPNSDPSTTTPQITIIGNESHAYNIQDIINITSGWYYTVHANGTYSYNSFWVKYIDSTSLTTSVTFRVYNITSGTLLQTNTTNLSVYNWSYHNPNPYYPSSYKTSITINHPYWSSNQTVMSFIYPYTPFGHGRYNGSWINYFLNHTIGPSPFRNTDKGSPFFGKEVPWVYIFIFFIAIFLALSFDPEHINVGVIASGLWLMFSAYIFSSLPVIGVLGKTGIGTLSAIGIAAVGLFMIAMGVLAELGGFR